MLIYKQRDIKFLSNVLPVLLKHAEKPVSKKNLVNKNNIRICS